MPRWFESTTDHGQVGYLAHPTQGYLTIERIGDYWHAPNAGRRTLFADRAKAMAEQVANRSVPRQYVIDTGNREMTVFAPDLVEPNIWVAAAARGAVINIAAVQRQEDAQGRAFWKPLVKGVPTETYEDPEAAMTFALEAAHQRLESNYGLRVRNGRNAKSNRRYVRFQEAITAQAPRGNHKIGRNEIKAAQLLSEIGFKTREIATSMRWAPEVVESVCSCPINEAHDHWVGRMSYPDHQVAKPRRIRHANPGPLKLTGEARAMMRIRHEQGDVIFTARDGGATAQMRDRQRGRTHALSIQPVMRGNGRAWQAMLNGRRMGAPKSRIPDAMAFAVNALHERAQLPTRTRPIGEAQSTEAQRQLEVAAARVPSITPADRQALAAGADNRASERAAAWGQTSQKTVPRQGNIAAILGMPTLAEVDQHRAHRQGETSPEMGA